ncbi:MerR family transcriptional regulator [Streptomyces sp. ME02-8801-2C]|uniref:MerR family transcriptional regulator n=1 Tax=Streptomyces sp. ME02-8801-2C TaxID=3028680 RepID=UPI0029AB7EDE|nr:MerR family transcriptional regulator [Streptomyces sp. ME02-8801-2C]MDX3455733.1 MerR family transcriptional regulator [Streptomyces sp. ME02-8801-2C]
MNGHGVNGYGAYGDDELLSIGAFAARARLSPKALRLYDRLGLLAPAHVDATSGYRYYRPAQTERARLVALLRQLARTLADFLRGRLSGRSSEMDGLDELYGRFVVETVDVPERVVLTETRHTLADELPAWIGASLGRLEAGARECGGVSAAPFVVYHSEVSMESDGPAESCVPVADEAAARAWVAAHGRARSTAVRVEPARRLAYTRIVKAQVAHPQIIAAFEAVERWMAGQGIEPVGPCREVYFADWDAAGPDDAVCDVAFPVGLSGGS